jgi:hypothetical protein
MRDAEESGESRNLGIAKVDSSELETLMNLKEEALVASMVAQETDFTFRRSLALIYRKYGLPIERSQICLGCGLIRPLTIERCPECA